MQKEPVLKGCHCCGMNRRQFLMTGCAACASAAGVMTAARHAHAAGGKPRIRVLYSLHAEIQPGPDWPNVGFDFRPVMEKFNHALRNAYPGWDFLPATAAGAEQAERILKEEGADKVDGYIVFQMNCWNRVVQTIAEADKPVLYADFKYGGSGGFLVYTAAFLRSGKPNLGFAASSDMDDLLAAVKCFEAVKTSGQPNDFAQLTARVRQEKTPAPGTMDCKSDKVDVLSPEETLERMKASKILFVRDQESGPGGGYLGIPMVQIAFSEVNAAWEKADRDEAKAVADRWQKGAKAIKDVPRETLENSAAMYLGMKEVLKKHDANAITMNCLGGFYGNHIHAYPCLGFHELNNQGMVGACECDIQSTATMVTFTAMTKGRPGYISDPVIDTAKRQIIYAHCVASNRPFGPEGAANDYEILTHSEDRQGAALRSLLPAGYMTTSMELNKDRKELLFHQGKSAGNDDDDRACRTKLCVEPKGDIEKLFTEWDRWGWHRVTFYGDLKEPVMALADKAGWKVTEEA
jgi:hypothetical protein